MRSEAILNAVALAIATIPGVTVRRPGDVPAQATDYPTARIRIFSESRRNRGKGQLQFLTTTVIRVTLETSAPQQLGTASASTAEAQLTLLKRQADLALYGTDPLFRIANLISAESQWAFSAEQTHLAGLQSDISFEFNEEPEDFAPPVVSDLVEVDLATTRYPPHGLAARLT